MGDKYQFPGASGQSEATFSIKSKYQRTTDSKNVDNMLKGVQILDEVKVVGPINIVSMVDTSKDILCCKYAHNFDNIVVGFTDGVVRLFKSSTSELVKTITDSETDKNASPVTAVRQRPISKNNLETENMICSYASGCVKSWNINSGQCNYTIREKRQTFGVAYHPRLPKFVTYGDNAKIYLYDEETRVQERIMMSSDTPGTVDGHTSRIFTCCFNPRSNHEFLSGGWDDMVFFWDLRQPNAFRHLSGIHMCGDGIDVSTKGTEILTCGWQRENALSLWDYGTGNLIASMEPDIHESMLYCGKFMSKDIIACGGSDPNILRFVEIKGYTTMASIGSLAGGVYSVDMCPPKKAKKPDANIINSLSRTVFCCGKRFYQIDFS